MGVVLVRSVEEEGESGDGEIKKTTNWENSQIKGYGGTPFVYLKKILKEK